MKKIICFLMAAIVFLAGCSPKNVTSQKDVAPTVTRTEFTRGVWLSFNEINEFLTSENGYQAEFLNVVKNLKEFNVTDLYLHIRSHCDSIIPSKLFPQTDNSRLADFDILEKAINICHSENIRVHAWINPYRVTASHSDIEKLPQDSPAVKWLKDENSDNDKNVVVMDGIYLNPAESQVRQLIVDGVKEILTAYNVDGIHFDDYFYPTAVPEFDKLSFEAYKKATKHPLKLSDWRRANVDTLIADCKAAIELSGKNVIFSVSPAADIDKNYNESFADLKEWCEKGLIDKVIPQIYFGFKHTDDKFNFENLLKDWLKLCQNSNVSLEIGLAAYKIGIQSPTDGKEWAENSDILSRQLKLCLKENRIGGVVFFSYSSLFSAEALNTIERENILKTEA